MFKKVVRPILFLFPHERTQEFLLRLLHVVAKVAPLRWLLNKRYTYRHLSLEREVFGVKFDNPIGLAAGFDRNAVCYRDFKSLGFGFVEVGTVTPSRQAGNQRPRIFRLPEDEALISRTGYPNNGLESAVARLRRRGYGKKIVVGVCIAKNRNVSPDKAAGDYLRLFRNLYQYVDYCTVNFKQLIREAESMGVSDAEIKSLLENILNDLFEFRRGQNQYLPILLKVSPDWSNERIDDIVDILIATPLDGLVVAGTTLSREGLKTSAKVLNNQIGGGGLSGEPLLPRTLELIRYVHDKMNGMYPIIGVGGVMTAEDAKAMLDAGASLVQVYTGLIYNGPTFAKNICKHLVESEGGSVQGRHNS
ncbi:MAG: quinone-dependent dihydroorotate dehydrogenase [Tidjanibacter sp.]|nr:quinone-dependent dihydroorotate dehydrogenase [Tidjanibacter sp.]